MAEAADAPKTEDKADSGKAPKEETKEEGSPKKAAPKGRGKGGKGRKGGKGGGAPRTFGATGIKVQLIEQVKHNQRSDAGWRAAWGNYCQQHGSDVRDPSKHAQSWLQRALQTLGAPMGMGGYQGAYRQSRASPHVVEQVKMNQRADPGWSQAWMNYCMMNGGGISDPSQHADRWLIRACHMLGPPQVQYQYMDSMGMIQQVCVPIQGNYIPQQYGGGYQQRQGSYPRSRGGYGGGGAPRSRGGGFGGGRPRSRGGGVPNMGQRGGLSQGGQRGGLRSRGGGGGGGGGGAPRSRGGGGASGRPRSRGGYRPSM